MLSYIVNHLALSLNIRRENDQKVKAYFDRCRDQQIKRYSFSQVASLFLVISQWLLSVVLRENRYSVAILGEGYNVLGSIFAGYVLLASKNPHPIIVYSVANYRPHLSHFWGNGNFTIPT